MLEDTEYLARSFRHFAGMCAGQSPLYEAVSPHIAEEPAMLALLAVRSPRQPPVNLLFGAVHCLLLAGTSHPLAEFYPSVGGDRDPAGAYPVFAEFCRRFEPEITAMIATRRVQTNEVGRCGLLLPGFARIADRFAPRPLHLIEVGCSAGLNLRFDHYTYEYTVPGGAIVHTCGPPSAVRVRTELREGTDAPLPDVPPAVAGRAGIDIAPVDVTDADATRWVEALIWPDQIHRHELFRAAVAMARTDPPRIIAGDGLDLLPAVVQSVAPDALPCVFHSHATCQMKRAWRDRFAARLTELGRGRDVAYLSLEWLGDAAGPQLHLTTHERGATHTTHLADAHHHGAWLRWLATD